MKCLSVRQPWASLIIRGTKDVENRTWDTDYRGRLAIHASKRRETEGDMPPEAWGRIIAVFRRNRDASAQAAENCERAKEHIKEVIAQGRLFEPQEIQQPSQMSMEEI